MKECVDVYTGSNLNICNEMYAKTALNFIIVCPMAVALLIPMAVSLAVSISSVYYIVLSRRVESLLRLKDSVNKTLKKNGEIPVCFSYC